MNPSQVVGVGAVSIPVILILIEVFKRIFPKAPGWVWLLCALILGTASQVLGQIAVAGAPATFAGWITLLGAGVAFGAATSKGYDETVGQARKRKGGEA